MIPVMNAALLGGVALVLPLALRERFAPWLVAAACVAVSLWWPAGAVAALFVMPWLALTVRAGVRALTLPLPAGERAGERAVFTAAVGPSSTGSDRPGRFWTAMIAGFAGTAALALLASRAELTLFDIREPIVKLTALHFTYAGAGTLALAVRLHELRPSPWTQLCRALVLAAPPVVASGFVLRSAVGQAGGALLMTAGVYLVALLQLPDARSGPGRWLFRLSCAAPWVAMGLGVSWATNQYFQQVPALTVPDMVPTHGALNAFGFVLPGLLGALSKTLTAPSKSETPAPADNPA